jgi:hypothetical protein
MDYVREDVYKISKPSFVYNNSYELHCVFNQVGQINDLYMEMLEHLYAVNIVYFSAYRHIIIESYGICIIIIKNNQSIRNVDLICNVELYEQYTDLLSNSFLANLIAEYIIALGL